MTEKLWSRLRPHKSGSNGDITSLKKQDGEVDAESLRSSYSNKSVHSLKDEQVIQIGFNFVVYRL